VAVLGAVVLQGDAEGKLKVTEHGGGLVAGGTTLGAAAGAITKHHEEKKIGLDAEEWFGPNSCAIVAVVDDLRLDRVDRALARATKKIDKAIDQGD
jgi:hypothetical protein